MRKKRKLLCYLFVGFFWLTGAETAHCQEELTEDLETYIPILTRLPVLVTHPETTFHNLQNQSLQAQSGISRLIQDWSWGKVIFLYFDDPARLYLEQEPDHYLKSYGGEFRAVFRTDQIVIVGGALGYSSGSGCLTSSIADAIMFHTRTRPGKVLTIHLISEATYYFESSLSKHVVKHLGPSQLRESSLYLNPKTWDNLLLNSSEAHYKPMTFIGGGVLPPVKGFHETNWPPPGLYPDRKPISFVGHLNTVHFGEYQFHLRYRGQWKGKKTAVWGHGDKRVSIQVWPTTEQFLKNSCQLFAL